MVRRRFDLTDEQWARIEPLIPARGRGAKPHCHRTMLNGMLWILRTGCPWRDIPDVYGSWKSVHTRFLRWCKSGVFERILNEISAEEFDDEFTMIDGSLVRVHQDAIGGKKMEPNALVDPEEARRQRFMVSWMV